ncbi:hypothetical protein PN4B1_16860 [Paenibacillus naphthalenovorans]|uniref:sigma factor-like helix-turn-helix DNA-binding protein n=1 Tax=Paenibacillus naphthalenovorans TaxID=162209 RepID=UPI0010B67F84|nr:sigma factor-like helix-turn-helix DNA-binding protein [Paenibacillus naphthalenovorans]GCL71781.1 hypothetical protein PN4B1_16860 [Paenibacillus naphthalenovorans]
MNRDKVTELLKDYRSYRFAVNNWTTYDGPDWGSKRIATGRGDLIIGLNEWDYRRYMQIVSSIEGAVAEVLDDDERAVIEMKYMNRNTLTLSQIGDFKAMSERSVKYVHKRALKKLTMALRFVEVPEIHNLDNVVVL